MKKFEIGEKVRIKATPTSSDGVKLHDGEVVTIDRPCEFYSKACYIKEYPNQIWNYGCFEKI